MTAKEMEQDADVIDQQLAGSEAEDPESSGTEIEPQTRPYEDLTPDYIVARTVYYYRHEENMSKDQAEDLATKIFKLSINKVRRHIKRSRWDDLAAGSESEREAEVAQPTTGPLTALQLNNEIVGLRKSVRQAAMRLAGRIVRQMKQIEKKKTKSDQEAQKNARKVGRLEQELKAIRKLKRDRVTKAALVNIKTHDELLKAAESAEERALAKLLHEPVYVQAIAGFRARHANWPREVPFLLQRLGAQYQEKKKLQKRALRKERKKKKKLSAGRQTAADQQPSEEEDEDDVSPAEAEEQTEESEEPKEPTADSGEEKVTKPAVTKKKTLKKTESKPKNINQKSSAAKSTRKANPPASESVVKRLDLNQLAAAGVETLTAVDDETSADHRPVAPAPAKSKRPAMESAFFRDGPAHLYAKRMPLPDQGEQFAIDAEAETDSPAAKPSAVRRSVRKADKPQQKFGGNRAAPKSSLPPANHMSKSSLPPPSSKHNPKALHPSWVARRQQRDALANAAPHGKRIVFNDD